MTLSLTTQHLEYLVAIDRADTWAHAAADVGVTPSALSQGIAELERRLGLSLFERDGRRRVPSRDHARVLGFAETTLAATGDLERWLVRRRGGEVGEVRLGMIDTAATHHFRDVLRAYRAEHPDVGLRLHVAPSAEVLRRLGRGDLDLAVCVRPAVLAPGLVATSLFDDPLSVLAPVGTEPGHPRAWGPWVTFPDGSHTRALIADALEAIGADFDVVAESHQPEVLREMVLLGVGWTVLPLAGVATEGIVVARDAIAHRHLVLVRRSAAADDPATDAMAAALLASAHAGATTDG